MERDYSKYQPTEYEKYRMLRSNNRLVTFDQITHFAHFSSSDKTVTIHVSPKYEFMNMYEWIADEGTEEQLKKFIWDHTLTEEHLGKDPKPVMEEDIAKQQKCLDSFNARYDIERMNFENVESNFYAGHPELQYVPLHNVLSGSDITMPLGEGILDFVYADFAPGYKDASFMPALFYNLRKEHYQKHGSLSAVKKEERPPETINNQLDLVLKDYYDFFFSCDDTRKITSVSLYTAVCPPIIARSVDTYPALKRYYQYLRALQNEYLEILKICFDEDYYPELLGKLSPTERYYIFRTSKDLPPFIERDEELYMAFAPPIKINAKKHEIDLSVFNERFYAKYPEESLKKLAAELNTTTDTLSHGLRGMRHITSRYKFSSTEDILELELSKMLENDIRFRKCKRCGRYFIMKGNYDTRFCDRIAEGETRSCQELAAQENYKKKMAENKALPIYSKYYKRYAARVKVRQIKESDFKKWKYEALVKRDECSAGQITAEEYNDWMEGCFPNRKRK